MAVRESSGLSLLPVAMAAAAWPGSLAALHRNSVFEPTGPVGDRGMCRPRTEAAASNNGRPRSERDRGLRGDNCNLLIAYFTVASAVAFTVKPPVAPDMLSTSVVKVAFVICSL